MSYSWATFGEFEIPSAGLEKLKAQEEEYVTDAEDLREDGVFSDTTYSGTKMRYLSIFEKSSYAAKRKVLAELLEGVIASGGTGQLTIVGFQDGPKEGQTLRIEGTKVVERKLTTKEVEAAREEDGYFAIIDKVQKAFDVEPDEELD